MRRSPSWPMRPTTKIDKQGRVRIPSCLRREFGLEPGTELLTLAEDGVVMMLTRESGVRHAQQLVAESLAGYKGSLVDEFIADRRREAAREIEQS